MPRLAVVLLASYALVAAGCTSQREHRASVAALDGRWEQDLEDDDVPDLRDHVRALGRGDPGEPASQVSAAVLAGMVVAPAGGVLGPGDGRPRGWKYPALLRADALAAAWRVARELPPRPYAPAAIAQEEFNARSVRFEQLLADPDHASDPEYFELIDFLATARLPVGAPGQRADLPCDLAQLVASQAAWGLDEPTRQGFARHAPASVVHALSGVTLLAARDADPTVREEAVRQATRLHPDTAFALLADALLNDRDSEVRRVALESLATLAESDPGPRWRELLGYVGPMDERPLRDRAAQLAESLP